MRGAIICLCPAPAGAAAATALSAGDALWRPVAAVAALALGSRAPADYGFLYCHPAIGFEVERPAVCVAAVAAVAAAWSARRTRPAGVAAVPAVAAQRPAVDNLTIHDGRLAACRKVHRAAVAGAGIAAVPARQAAGRRNRARIRRTRHAIQTIAAKAASGNAGINDA